ncbi:hypothetical protein JXM83_07490 [Candidatus Woesearchaeota archaeon]|nr:hypothetical protein [Candidatus Woesearchaeota archaeon]
MVFEEEANRAESSSFEVCVYFDKRSGNILDFLPKDIDEELKTNIMLYWNQEIPRKILQFLCIEDEGVTSPRIKEQIGHSMSTLHENIKKLEIVGLIKTSMIYEGNKQKIIKPRILFVSQNTTLTKSITSFLNRGLWVDSKRSQTIIDFLMNNSDKYFTPEEISAKTGIQVDEVITLLDNWDSTVTRAFSQFMKTKPFEKKVLYKGIGK